MPQASSSYRRTQGVDPSAPGTIVRNAIAWESVVIVGAGTYLLFFPKHFLLQTAGIAASQTTLTALQLTQHFGAMNVLAGATAALCIPDTKMGIEMRATLYRVFLGLESVFVPLLVWQAFKCEGSEGIGRKQLLVGAAQFVPWMVWRVWTLGWRSEWFGRWLDGNVEKGE